jgi:hypothetical protein
MRIFKGTVTIGVTEPKSGVQLPPFLAPKGSNGEFITREPFYVPVPVQVGDKEVKGSKVEVVTEINEKVLKKALTPAATMLSFFKTKGPLEPAQAEEGEEIGCGSGDGDKSGASRDSRSHSQNSQGGAGQKRGAFFSSTSQSSSSSSDTKKVIYQSFAPLCLNFRHWTSRVNSVRTMYSFEYVFSLTTNSTYLHSYQSINHSTQPRHSSLFSSFTFLHTPYPSFPRPA